MLYTIHTIATTNHDLQSEANAIFFCYNKPEIGFGVLA